MSILGSTLTEATSALSGDFEPIRDGLCSQIARRVADDVIKHQKLVAQFHLVSTE
jgi:hypothetical protein